MKHMDLIAEYCEVLDVRYGRAIWYVDGGYRYADVLEEGEGWVSYSCDTREMWEMLCGEQSIFYWLAGAGRTDQFLPQQSISTFSEPKKTSKKIKKFFPKHLTQYPGHAIL